MSVEGSFDDSVLSIVVIGLILLFSVNFLVVVDEDKLFVFENIADDKVNIVFFDREVHTFLYFLAICFQLK